MNEPIFGHGKICYIEIPAKDIAISSAFYQKVFNWTIQKRPSSEVTFDDGVGGVSGVWVLNAAPVTNPTMVVHIMVDDAEVTLRSIVKNGGEIVQPIGKDIPEITAKFRDPAGNVLGIYQHRG